MKNFQQFSMDKSTWQATIGGGTLLGDVTKRLHDILIAIIVFLIYGSVLWGVLPGAAGVSWQAHLGGAVGGVISASRLARHSR